MDYSLGCQFVSWLVYGLYFVLLHALSCSFQADRPRLPSSQAAR